jgi:cytochrome c peroxidase
MKVIAFMVRKGKRIRPLKKILVSVTLVVVTLSFSGLSTYSDDSSSHEQNKSTTLRRLEYEPPVPGSYRLPPIQQAVDGEVIDTDGRKHRLFDWMGDKYVLLSFIYTTCSDVKGCPLATFTLNDVRVRLEKDPTIAEKLRFLTLSFDPDHDTPEVMRQYVEQHGFEKTQHRWHFLTTASWSTLRPILEGYGQYVVPEHDSRDRDTGGFSHVLKVYLIDLERKVRNIYSISFLYPELIINDIKTLILEQGALERTKKSHLGLPEVPFPEDNSPSVAKIQLGRKLFFDRRLSHNNTLSCAMCHVPEQGFTVNELATAVGREGKSLRRNAPTLLNVAFLVPLFHDGRETNLETQVLGPLLAADEMGNPSVGYLIKKIKRFDDYRKLFERAFGRGVGIETIGQALATYQRTLISAHSPFDRWYYGKESEALTTKEKEGFSLFVGKAACVNCHLLNKEYTLFTDNDFHNTGLGWYNSMMKPATEQSISVQLAPGVFASVNRKVVESVGLPKPNDLGRYEVTLDPSDRWRYKTPTLRNIALTAPYMHDGSLSTLHDVVMFYNQGGHPHENLDPLITPLHLNEEEIEALVAFLNTLTGDNIQELIQDARSERIGNPGTNFSSITD